MQSKSKFYLLVLFLVLSSSVVCGQSEKKVAYGILIDNTGSLRSQFEQVLNLGKAVARHATQKGPVSVFNFTSPADRRSTLAVISSGSDWSQDGEDLSSFIDNIYVLGGQTTLLDAIQSMSRTVSAKVTQEKDVFSDGVLILITDGEERESRIKESDLIKQLQKDGTKVFAIGLVKDLGAGNAFGSKGKQEKAENLLWKLARETGGRVIFPESRNMVADMLVGDLFAP